MSQGHIKNDSYLWTHLSNAFFNSHKFKILNFTLILPYFLENQRPRTRNCKKVIQISRKSREVPGQGRVKYYAQMLFNRDKRKMKREIKMKMKKKEKNKKEIAKNIPKKEKNR